MGKVLDPLELQLKIVVSHLTWVLGTKLQFSGKATSALNHWAIISQAPYLDFLQNSLPSEVTLSTFPTKRPESSIMSSKFLLHFHPNVI